MNKATILQWAGMDSETVDFAVPQEWANAINKLNIDNNHFFWHYPKKQSAPHTDCNCLECRNATASLGGRPMDLAECFIKAVQLGNLVPLRTVIAAMERARETPNESLESIVELIKIQCAAE